MPPHRKKGVGCPDCKRKEARIQTNKKRLQNGESKSLLEYPDCSTKTVSFCIKSNTLAKLFSVLFNETVTNTLKKAYLILTSQMEDYMQNGKINPVAGIFLMKNNMGYQDKQEVVLTPNNPLGDVDSNDKLEEKYIEQLQIEGKDVKKG